MQKKITQPREFLLDLRKLLQKFDAKNVTFFYQKNFYCKKIPKHSRICKNYVGYFFNLSPDEHLFLTFWFSITSSPIFRLSFWQAARLVWAAEKLKSNADNHNMSEGPRLT